jgi:hypothetical protein
MVAQAEKNFLVAEEHWAIVDLVGKEVIFGRFPFPIG